MATMRLAAAMMFLCLWGSMAAPKVTHFLQLAVEGEDEEAAALDMVKELEELIQYSKKQKHTENLIMLLRSGKMKVSKSVEDARVKRERNEKRKKDKAKKQAELEDLRTKEAPFTSGETVVRALKESAKASHCNIPTYQGKAEFTLALDAGSVDLSAPFIVANALQRDSPQAKSFREGWSAEALKALKDVGIKYLTPRLAKVMMEGGKDSGQTMEVFQPQIINFETYFGYCFGKKKTPGTETEHCEQHVPALALAEMGRGKMASGDGMNATALLNSLVEVIVRGGASKGQAGELALLSKHEQSLEQSLAGFQSLLKNKGASEGWLAGGEVLEESMRADKQSSRTVILGPTGSGKTFKSNRLTPSNPQMQEPPKTLSSAASFVDLQMFGSRRWVLLSAQRIEKLGKEAQSDFNPVSAFSFFEEQYADLKEEYGLEFKKGATAKNGGAWECNQRVGDALFVPADLFYTSLALDDGLSYRQQVLTKGPGGRVSGDISRSVWNPVESKWGPAACFAHDKSSKGMEALPFWDELGPNVGVPKGTPAKDVVKMVRPALMKQMTERSTQNQLLLKTLVDCRAALNLHPVVPASSTVCGQVWDKCAAAFRSNLEELGEKGTLEESFAWVKEGLVNDLVDKYGEGEVGEKTTKKKESGKKSSSSKGKGNKSKKGKKKSKKKSKAKTEL